MTSGVTVGPHHPTAQDGLGRVLAFHRKAALGGLAPGATLRPRREGGADGSQISFRWHTARTRPMTTIVRVIAPDHDGTVARNLSCCPRGCVYSALLWLHIVARVCKNLIVEPCAPRFTHIYDAFTRTDGRMQFETPCATAASMSCKAADVFAEIHARGVRPFPCAELEQQLRGLWPNACKSASELYARFFKCLHREIRRRDREWSTAASRLLFHERLVRSKLSPLVVCVFTPMDAADEARRLAAWAELTREAVDGLLEKYNKWFGDAYGCMGRVPDCGIKFIASPLLTRIEELACSRHPGRGHANVACASLPVVESDTAAVRRCSTDGCPVCLEVMPTESTLLACGHEMCAPCCRKLRSHARANGITAQCPLCRAELGSEFVHRFLPMCCEEARLCTQAETVVACAA